MNADFFGFRRVLRQNTIMTNVYADVTILILSILYHGCQYFAFGQLKRQISTSVKTKRREKRKRTNPQQLAFVDVDAAAAAAIADAEMCDTLSSIAAGACAL
jgi:hypothetical protein